MLKILILKLKNIELHKRKHRKDFDYEDEIFSIPNKNKKNKKSLPIPAIVLKSNIENNLKIDNRMKRDSDLLKKKYGKEYIIGQTEIKDLDRQYIKIRILFQNFNN